MLLTMFLTITVQILILGQFVVIFTDTTIIHTDILATSIIQAHAIISNMRIYAMSAKNK